MDLAATRKRSASHGSLRSTYRAHGRPTFGHQPSIHRPLRSVNENTALLHSPGPLESMLKTTTETGDIGIFTIRPVVSSRSLHTLPGAKSRLGDFEVSAASDPRRREGQGPRDTRKPAPCYRDTTCEIISMYSSDTQQSWASSLSPPVDDSGQRSYSMTTCGSTNCCYSTKSSGTLHSRSSNSALQRPRSPFPYPTRLKRPGVRPSSPALTEDGGIDYSRMVEIDRVSYRTVHGSYKPIYPQGPRQPPPLSLRTNRAKPSTAMLCHGPPSYQSGHIQIGSLHAPHIPGLWVGSQPERNRRPSVSTLSVRTASLTSIVEMYGRPSSSIKRESTLPSGGSFFYDYSENFVGSQTGAAGPAATFETVPARDHGQSRPFVPRDESCSRLEDLDIVNARNRVGYVDRHDERGYTRQHQFSYTLDDIMSQEQPIDDTADDLFPYESDLALLQPGPLSLGSDIERCTKPRSSEGSAERSPSREIAGHDHKEHNRWLASRGNTHPLLATPSDTDSWTQRQNPLINENEPTVAVPAPESDISGRRPPKDTIALNKCPENDSDGQQMFDGSSGSSVSPVGGAALGDETNRLPVAKETEALSTSKIENRALEEGIVSAICPASACSSYSEDKSSRSETEGINTFGGSHPRMPRGDARSTDKEVKYYVRKHKRNLAVPRFSATTLQSQQDKAKHFRLQENKSMEILSPQPISPARGLRVKNSIPQFMEAEVPGLCHSELAQSNQPEDEADFAVRFSSFNISRLSTPNVSVDSMSAQEGTPSRHPDGGPAKNMARLKLRVRPSPSVRSAMTSRSCNSTKAGSEGPASADGRLTSIGEDAPAKKSKLRLKMPREVTAPSMELDVGTVRRYPPRHVLVATGRIDGPPSTALDHNDIDDGDSLGDETEYSREDLHNEDADRYYLLGNPTATETPTPDGALSEDRDLTSQLAAALVLKPASPTTRSLHSFSTDTKPAPVHGLRNKLSNLRLMLSGSYPSRKNSVAKGRESSMSAETAPLQRPLSENPVSTASRPFVSERKNSRKKISVHHRDRLTVRMKRWVRGARHVVGRYVRRDRARRLSGPP